MHAKEDEEEDKGGNSSDSSSVGECEGHESGSNGSSSFFLETSLIQVSSEFYSHPKGFDRELPSK
jgi:hypothetical protein